MRLRDYAVDDATQFSAKFINQVTSDFSTAMAEAYLELRELKMRNDAYRIASNTAMDYLIGQLNGVNTEMSNLKISCYNPVLSSSNIQLDNVYGQLSLAESNRITHIPTSEDNYGKLRAISSVTAQTGRLESSFSTNDEIRKVLDDENDLWMEERAASDTDSGSIWIRITTPIVGITPNFVSIYPIGGTEVEQIKVVRQCGDTVYEPASTWPVKRHQNFSEYSREVRFKIKGVLNDSGNYIFMLRKIDIYTVTYASSGTFTYRTQDEFSTISAYVYNDPYFYPAVAQDESMVKIRILTDDGLTVLHDSSLSTTIDPVPAGAAHVRVEVTLYRVNGNTPFIRTIQ